MANRVFQGVVYQMKDAIDRMIGVVDEKMLQQKLAAMLPSSLVRT